MSTTLVRGQNATLEVDNIEFTLTAPGCNIGKELDLSAVLLGANGQVTGDDDFIFYNQPRHPSGGIERLNDASFDILLNRVPSHIERIAMVFTLESGLASLGRGYQIRAAGGHQNFIFEGDGSGRQEKSLIACEFYRRNGSWKIKIIDQGFAGGMAPLAEHFGVVVEPLKSSAPPRDSKPAATGSPSASNDRSAAPSAPPINLSKITLDKRGDKISLEKKSSAFGEIEINLNWNQGSGATSGAGGLLAAFRGKSSGNIDLDLGCLFELRDGTKSVVQALGDTFGHYDRPPYIKLDADDRTGANQAGETLRINGAKWSEVKRVIVFAFIYEGVANWAKTDGVVRIRTPDQPEIEIRMDAAGSNERFCVVALLENNNGSLGISKEVNYFSGHSHADKHYGFGMRWQKGSK